MLNKYKLEIASLLTLHSQTSYCICQLHIFVYCISRLFSRIYAPVLPEIPVLLRKFSLPYSSNLESLFEV